MNDIQVIVPAMTIAAIVIAALAKWQYQRQKTEDADRHFNERLGPLT